MTGSNSYMLSSDLATFLSGRYVEIMMLPLSFKEYLEVTGVNPDQELAEYMHDGGLPYVAAMGRNSDKVSSYIEGIYNTVIIQNIEARQVRKEKDPNRKNQ